MNHCQHIDLILWDLLGSNPFDESDIEEIRHINREMRDVNDMMNMISSHISLQSDGVDNIVSNISDSKNNCKRGKDEVKKAQEYQDKENGLYWILGAGIGVPTILGIVIASVFLS